MPYTRFEELPVWQAAVDLAAQVYALTAERRLPPSLQDQLERATLSVSNNIAEGFERATTRELLALLYIARGSAGEVRSILHVAGMVSADPGTGPRLAGLRSLAEGISRQLSGWAAFLERGDITGRRHLTEPERRQVEQAKARDEFEATVQELLAWSRGEQPR